MGIFSIGWRLLLNGLRRNEFVHRGGRSIVLTGREFSAIIFESEETFTLASREISSLLEHAQAGSGWIVDYVPMFKAYSKDNKLYDTGRMQAAAR